MNFKLNRQQVLHIALLLAIILVAIYLLKPTLEGKGGKKCPCPTICPCHPKDDKGIEGTWIGSINSGRDKKGSQLQVEIKRSDSNSYNMTLVNEANLTKPSPSGKNWKSGRIYEKGNNLYEIRYTFDDPSVGESVHTARIINGNELVLCNTNRCVLKTDRKTCDYPCTVTSSYTRKGTNTNSQYDAYINTNHCPLSCIDH